jgi:hypothetical protein
VKLAPEDLDKLQTKEIANLIRKLNSGGTLTGPQRALLAQTQAGGSAPATGSAFAQTWDDLAQRLGVSRKSLQNWRNRPDLASLLPRDRADGRKDVAAWVEAMREHNLADAGEGSDATGADSIDERYLRLRERQLAVEKAEHKLAEQKRQVLQLTDYQAALRVTLGGFDGALKQLAGRAADALALRTREATIILLRRLLTPKQFEKLDLNTVGIDTAAMVEILESEIEILRSVLAEADFLEPQLLEED